MHASSCVRIMCASMSGSKTAKVFVPACLGFRTSEPSATSSCCVMSVDLIISSVTSTTGHGVVDVAVRFHSKKFVLCGAELWQQSSISFAACLRSSCTHQLTAKRGQTKKAFRKRSGVSKSKASYSARASCCVGIVLIQMFFAGGQGISVGFDEADEPEAQVGDRGSGMLSPHPLTTSKPRQLLPERARWPTVEASCWSRRHRRLQLAEDSQIARPQPGCSIMSGFRWLKLCLNARVYLCTRAHDLAILE